MSAGMPTSAEPRGEATGGRKSFAVYVITRHGIAHAQRLIQGLPPDTEVYVSERRMADALEKGLKAKPMALPMGPVWAETFNAYDCHVPIVSVGAVVRMVAPFLANKKKDPAIVCVDDAARFAVCLLSGHVGRGNVFTERVATLLGAQPVVTTASDVTGTLTVDILGRDLGWVLEDPDRNVTRGCAAVVNGEPVLVVQEAGEPEFWPLDKQLPPGVHYTTTFEGVDGARWETILAITDRQEGCLPTALWEKMIVFRPKSLVMGLGCDRGTPPELLERGIAHWLSQEGYSMRCLRSVATIDKKADEPAILEFCRRHGLPLITYSAEALDGVSGIETPSETVKRHVGTRGVSEPAALLASGASRLLVPKRVYTEPEATRSMTLALARIPHGVRSPVVVPRAAVEGSPKEVA